VKGAGSAFPSYMVGLEAILERAGRAPDGELLSPSLPQLICWRFVAVIGLRDEEARIRRAAGVRGSLALHGVRECPGVAGFLTWAPRGGGGKKGAEK